MTINLNRFVETTEAVVPLIDNWGKYQGRKIELQAEDGWYKVRLGNQVTIIKKASPLEIRKALEPEKKLMVYALGGEGVPVNFDNFKKRGYQESIPIYFMGGQPFDIIEIVLREDGRFYFYGVNQRHQRELVRGVKEAYQARRVLPELRGVTPEIRYAFMLGHLQRESYEAVESILKEGSLTISGSQRDRITKQLQSSFSVVLKSAITKAGGTYVGHRKLNQSTYAVDWRVGDQLVKSHINADLRIVSAGFCLSGDDKRHSMSSIIGLAKTFQENRPLYITRE